ncbi:MAG: calcium-binding protein, partial [Pseudomonadota bacterium]
TDHLQSHGGDDILIGGHGVDFLTGGSGADTFVFASDGFFDYVQDFNEAEDTIMIDSTHATSFADVQTHASQYGTSVLVQFDPSTKLFISNMTIEELDESYFTYGDTSLLY